MHVTPLFGTTTTNSKSPTAPNDKTTFTIDDLQPRTFIELLDRHKAVLLQASSTTTPSTEGEEQSALVSSESVTNCFTTDDFGAIVTKLQLTYYPYIGGAAPRTIIPVTTAPEDHPDIIFTANESPPDQPIPFHHELAQTDSPPEYIFFYCHTPCDEVPGGHGQTPIIDSTLVYRYVMDTYPELISKLHEHGVRYIRTLPATTDANSPIGRSYQDTYQVKSRNELEIKLQNMEGCTWEWLPGHDGGSTTDDDACVRITSPAVPAIRYITNHCTNYIYQYTFANSIIAAYLGWQDVRNNRFESIRLGNMELIDPTILDDIAQFMETNRILYTWKKGDIMALNNRLVMHSRNPYTGPRRVFASIWGAPKLETWNIPQPMNGVALGTIPSSYFESLQPVDPLIFGFWKVAKDICADVCYNAIKVGYRRLDCACDYGNEIQVGIGIRKAIDDGLCTREDLFITSKLWNTYHTHPDHVLAAIQKTLSDLQLTYIDEYLIHFPISMEYIPIETKYPPEWTNMDGKMVIVPNDICGTTWKAMESLVEMGLTRTIGVCNFSTQLLRQLLSTCQIRPTTLQIELHPHNTQERLVRFAHDAGIRVTAFSVLGASSYIELNMASTKDVLLLDPTVMEIAKAKNKSTAQILLRWALQRNTLPLCKTSTIERMIENRNIYDFYLTVQEMNQISALNKCKRYNDPGEFCEPGMGTFCPIYD